MREEHNTLGRDNKFNRNDIKKFLCFFYKELNFFKPNSIFFYNFKGNFINSFISNKC